MEDSQFDIFFVPAPDPGRSYALVLQGLLEHPRVRLVDSAAESDYVFCHNDAWDTTTRFPAGKFVFIDFHDDPYRIYPVRCTAYFKRSWAVPRTNGPRFSMDAPPRPSFMHPTAYAVMDEFVVSDPLERDIDVSCLLRREEVKRQVVLNTLGMLNFGSRTTRLGEVNSAGRGSFNREYLETLRRSRIVITANPDEWEGDSRLWEALANGALVFVDRMHTPLDQPLVDRVHCIFYDVESLDDGPFRLKPMLGLLDHYLEHPDEVAEIAARGRGHALRHHRAVDRIDAMLQRLPQKTAPVTRSLRSLQKLAPPR